MHNLIRVVFNLKYPATNQGIHPIKIAALIERDTPKKKRKERINDLSMYV